MMEVNVRKLILTTVSVLSLGVGAGMSLAADTTNVAPNAGSNMPAASGTPSYSTTAMNSSSAEIRQAQQQLQNQGFYHGQIDGIVGPDTEQALGQFQKQNGLSQTATLDQPTMDKLLGSAGSQRSRAPTIFHGAGSTANPQPGGSAGNMPKQ
jgi:peptidoglycan hydrolase-like protein with peptidoglycan-binding domain